MGIIFMACGDLRDGSIWDYCDYGNPGPAAGYGVNGNYGWGENRLYKFVPPRADYFVRAWGKVTSTGYPVVLRFREGGTSHVNIAANFAAGNVAVQNYNSSANFGVGTCPANTGWNCIEAYVKVHDSAGAATIKVNGATILTLTGLDTRNGGTGVIDRIIFEPIGAAFSDGMIRDDDWPGQGSFKVLAVTANGDTNNWSASTGSQYACVDEIPPSDTDYISADAGTAGTLQDFAVTDLSAPLPDIIVAVGVMARAKLSVAGSGKVRAYLKVGSDYVQGPDAILSTTVGYVGAYSTTKPAGGAWDSTAVNALLAGVETRT